MMAFLIFCLTLLIASSIALEDLEVTIKKSGQILTEIPFPGPATSRSTRLVIRSTLIGTPTDGYLAGYLPAEAVSITAAYRGVLSSWKLDDLSPKGNRSLCFSVPVTELVINNKHTEKNDVIALALFSTYRRDINVRIGINEENLFLEVNETRRLALGYNAPQVLQYIPPATATYGLIKDETYLVSIDSVEAEDMCMFVAINPPGCPWHGDESTVRNSRIWARTLDIGYFPVSPLMFPDGFTITLVPLLSGSGCVTGPSPQLNSTVKVVDVRIDRTPGSYSYLSPILVSTFLVLGFAIIILLIWIGLWRCNKGLGRKRSDSSTSQAGVENRCPMCGHCGMGSGDGASVPRVATPPLDQDNSYRGLLWKAIQQTNLDRGDHTSTHCLQAVNRLKKEKLHITDMTQNMNNSWHRRQRSKTYLLLVPLIAIYYIVPSAQMVYAEFTRAKESGNMERCYLNYGCSRPLKSLEIDDFNHMISNMGYFIYGLAFIFMVAIKSKLLPEGHKTHEDHLSSTGLLQQHSIFFTMGVCMIFQGFFSVIFHLCPSNISLQFDTTMMYIMMILVFIKIFQLRHPDTAYNAFHAMGVFSIALVFEALSLYATGRLFRIILYLGFSLLYLFLMVHMAVDIYYYGAIKTNYKKMVPVFVKHSVEFCGNVLYKKKFLLTTLFFLANVTILAIILILTYKEPGRSLSTPMLVVCGFNVGSYLMYYFFNKIAEVVGVCWRQEQNQQTEQEQLWTQTAPKVFMRLVSFVFFGLAVIVGGVAAYFYAQRHQSRNSTPPESRNLNEPCNWMNFYDNHDMWHFFSSTALFLAFVGLLTIDDDLLFVPRDQIPVF